MFLVSGFLLILFVVITFVYLSSFFRKLFVVSKAMNEIATGETDLTARIPIQKKDELGQLAISCNDVIAKLQIIMASIKESVVSLTNKSTQLHSDIQLLSSNLNEQNVASESATINFGFDREFEFISFRL